MGGLNYPLSNMQIELLKLFSRDMGEEDVKAIKNLIVEYLSKKLVERSDEVWKEKGWDNEYMEELLNAHLRASDSGKRKGN